ncbi:hypothetical protein F0C08_22950 [Salmonella enterica]|uniref:Uncharacterized protein n=2 Tax=Salmonella enterica TaxID=28901 RepID=A0A5Y3Q6Z7_SALER|nr:hypothetical protein [Salmonella enterica]EAA6774433.1 hypothetical protein [Salmonella enterica subsp. enterica serovar Braenderup]EAO5814793.1 hypothetical protein [Salmonella enterica subsp. enterica serovar Senftenberg]EAW3953822.1 hypothetical protein [Salmonella enterica subsp. enterica]EBQ9105340.1 hypothetical protein [Salmonella enterica subsp. enterica serovar Tennessee]EBX8088225.1 hypothetical protein [Salmonella enterica subsp. enterica serovar Choleraesuis]ECI4735768.1 hypoth
MDKIKTRRSERRLSRYLIEEALRLVAERSECEGVSKETAKRHASAIRGVIPALGVVKSKVIKPGVWVALYARNDSTSTVISNMKFTAVIFEWAGQQDYEDAAFYVAIANAIRTALAVRGDK